MDISENLRKSLGLMKFTEPTEIQEKAIPVVLTGKDVIIRSKTGSGKTAAYLLPVLNSVEKLKGKGVKAIIILPTRELALQTHRVASRLGKISGIKSTIVYGGASIIRQVEELPGSDIVIGTPGRILDLYNQKYLKLDHVKYLVLDEADLMLDMGFIDDIKKIISFTPEGRQTILLSATLPAEVKTIANHFMNNPEFVDAGGDEAIPSSIKHLYTVSEKFDKFSTLMSYIHSYNSRKAIVFVKTQRSGDLLNLILSRSGFNNVLIHGGMKQHARERSIADFRHIDSGILVATNVAARGLDIPNITDIINFDAPESTETYAHRVGRSGRMGKDGRAMTIFDPSQKSLIQSIQRRNRIKMEKINIDLETEYTDINYGKLIAQFRDNEENAPEPDYHSRGRRPSGGRDRRPSSRRETGSRPGRSSGNYRRREHQ
ncbi:DEAD box protein [Ferroplasma acidiphilum]|uniref:DEAD box protein n=3 Tax=Ferroplasma acidiphilum TaxID=74969 RepID=A0A1V0N3D7_9ARCH|nr:DEAD box protein [Ferroplasma acidiphilum]